MKCQQQLIYNNILILYYFKILILLSVIKNKVKVINFSINQYFQSIFKYQIILIFFFAFQIPKYTQEELRIEEEKVLLQALRENNLSKIHINDLPIFNSLINDLFPGIEASRQLDQDLQQKIIQVCQQTHIQPADSFTIKIHQFYNLLNVRHSVFILGGASTGKTAIWQTLAKALDIEYTVIDPKAIPRENLYGYVNPINKEWTDGIFSKILRDYVESGPPKRGNQKWLIMSGDVDTLWIESINSLMDDSKILTLPSNERISFKPWMRLIIEVKTLQHASPATVSRAGVVFVNPDDINPYMLLQKWCQDTQSNINYQNEFKYQFEEKQRSYQPITEIIQIVQERGQKYIKLIQSQLNYYSFSVYQTDMTITTNILQLLSSLIKELWNKQCFAKLCQTRLQQLQQNQKTNIFEKIIEDYIAFSTIHAFGGGITVNINSGKSLYTKDDFSKQWNTMAQDICGPQVDKDNSIFDYFVDINQETLQSEWIHFNTLCQQFQYVPDTSINNIFVETTESARIDYLTEHIVSVQGQIMLCGGSGLGKTVLLKRALQKINEKYNYESKQIQFNYYTDSAQLQERLEELIAKSGKIWQPKSNKEVNILIDDINMPMVDTYGTQQVITFLRQLYDWKMWYDKEKIQQKHIEKIHIHATMNPSAGSFQITEQYQNKFFVIQIEQQSPKLLENIYGQILKAHFQSKEQYHYLLDIVDNIIKFIIQVHQQVVQNFQPTAQKFLYNFNLRNISQVIGQIMQVQKFSKQEELIMLTIHELKRSYSDKLFDDQDREKFERLLEQCYNNSLSQLNIQYQQVYNFYYSYLLDSQYSLVQNYEQLFEVISQNLQDYNACNTQMNLFLFQEAINHVNKISRALIQGDILLLGYGGSGKQSLARLASYSINYNITQFEVNSSSTIQTLKEDLQKLLIKAGVRQSDEVLLITEQQIFSEEVLVLLAELLANREIQNLYPAEQKSEIIDQCRSRTKALGLIDDDTNCWQEFINGLHKHLKVIICMSPGDLFKQRSSRFPSIVNCTQIDQFEAWSKEALIGVGQKFVEKIDLNVQCNQEQLVNQISNYLASIYHEISTQLTKEYYQNTHKSIICTPKSYLELIKTFQLMLNNRQKLLQDQIDILNNGIEKLFQTEREVQALKNRIGEQEKLTKEKRIQVQAIVKNIQEQTEKTNIEKEKANKSKAISDEIEKEAQLKNDEIQEKDAAAQIIKREAEKSLDTLDSKDLQEIYQYEKPPKQIQTLIFAVIYLSEQQGKIGKNVNWKYAQKIMAATGKFMDSLINFDSKNIHDVNKNKIFEMKKQYPDVFDYNIMSKKSAAAGGLCNWINNILEYNRICLSFRPLEEEKEKLQKELDEAKANSSAINKKIQILEEQTNILTQNFNKQNNELNALIEQENRMNSQLNAATRLINGLSGEKIRWTQNKEDLEKQQNTVIGDMLLASSYTLYAGGFNKNYRVKLQNLLKQQIQDFNIKASQQQLIELITDEVKVTLWQSQKLPNDSVSIENAAIFTSSSRWPYLIDPQQQGYQWIKNYYKNEDFIITNQKNQNFIQQMQMAVQNGQVVFIENISKEIPASIKNLVNKEVNISAGIKSIQVGNSEIIWNDNFRLILQSQDSQPNISAELQAQVTLIDFSVTFQGLEEQLLADVVSLQKPDLENTKKQLFEQQNSFKLQLKQLSNELLYKLSNVGDNIIEDMDLINQLEEMKEKSQQIEQQAQQALITEKQIDQARNVYRNISQRGASLYFNIDSLKQISNFYIFSLGEIKKVFLKKIAVTDQKSENESDQEQQNISIQQQDLQDEELEKQKYLNQLLVDSTNMVHEYVSTCLFTKHQILFDTQIAFSILRENKSLSEEEYNFIVTDQIQVTDIQNPLPDIVNQQQWNTLAALSNLQSFSSILQDVTSLDKRWREWISSEQPEILQMPSDYKNCTQIQQLCILKALRQDRLISGLKHFVETTLQKDNNQNMLNLQDFTNIKSQYYTNSPIFFTLTPGVNPLPQVEQLAAKYHNTVENNRFKAISLGQGQEPFAQDAINSCMKNGGWVFLQNIHLMKRWQPKLLQLIQQPNPNQQFRLFLSAEPNPDPNVQNVLPQILQLCVKITQEPQSGLKAVLLNTLSLLKQEDWEACSSKPQMFKQLLFNLCFFHSVLIERKKYTNIGWNVNFNISDADLLISRDILLNYLENYQKVPWQDLNYMIGTIIYGGNVTDVQDQRYLSAYCNKLFCDKATQEGYELAQNVYTKYIANKQEAYDFVIQNTQIALASPTLVGLHPNSEISTLMTEGEIVCENLIALSNNNIQQQSSIQQLTEIVSQRVEQILALLPSEFDTNAIRQSSSDPFTVVLAQECDRMNSLINIIKTSLQTVKSGLDGEIAINDQMQQTINSIYNNQIPNQWKSKCFMTMKQLQGFITDLEQRIHQLQEWQSEGLKIVQLGYLFNPQSLLRSVIQKVAREQKLGLDQLDLQIEVLKINKEQIQQLQVCTNQQSTSLLINGIHLCNARWDQKQKILKDAILKDLYPELPIIKLTANVIQQDQQSTKDQYYDCPIYKIKQRNRDSYIWSFKLKTKDIPDKWIFSSVAGIMEVN